MRKENCEKNIYTVYLAQYNKVAYGGSAPSRAVGLYREPDISTIRRGR
jgi:hypothetical protein